MMVIMVVVVVVVVMMADLNDDEEPMDLAALHVEMVWKMIGRPASVVRAMRAAISMGGVVNQPRRRG